MFLPAQAAQGTDACRRSEDCAAGTECLFPRLGVDQGVCCPDADGDGHHAASCGGDDCDDGDADRFPGNTEVCDAGRHDEDCDPATFGWRDLDRDGFPDGRCCNDGDGGPQCGTDCDDAYPAFAPNSQVCNGRDVVVCTGGNYERRPCPAGTVCVPQPNDTGVCSVEPEGYVEPTVFVAPQPRPLPGLDEALGRVLAPKLQPALRRQIQRPALQVKPKPKEGGGGANAG